MTAELTAYMACRWIHAAELAAQVSELDEFSSSEMHSHSRGWRVIFRISGTDNGKMPAFIEYASSMGYDVSPSQQAERFHYYTVRVI